jgi:hypothetical protein
VQRPITWVKESPHLLWVSHLPLREQRCEWCAEALVNLSRSERLTQCGCTISVNFLNAPTAPSPQRDSRPCGAHHAPSGTLRGATRARRALPRRNALVPPDQQWAGIKD